MNSLDSIQAPSAERIKAVQALSFIMPILEKHNFEWVITGGFATLAHGVDRPLTDIDIDIRTSKDSPEFEAFMSELHPYITQPLEHWVDQNYDNYNFEITIADVVIDMCPMKEMQVKDKNTGIPAPFYGEAMPETEWVDFEGLKLPLLSKTLIVKNKEMLAWQREADHADVAALRALMEVK